MNTDISKFNTEGYVVIRQPIDFEFKAELIAECGRLKDIGEERLSNGDGWVMNSPNNPCKLDGAMKSNPIFRRLGQNRKLVDIAKELLDISEIDTYISKFFPMIPYTGFSVGWHQDNHYIKADPSKLISCDIFVQGATKERGCLRVIPRSHLENHGHHKSSHNGIFNWMSVNDAHSGILDIELEECFAIFFHPNLVHSCYENKSNGYRYSIAWEYIQRGYVPSTHNGHISQDRIQVI